MADAHSQDHSQDHFDILTQTRVMLADGLYTHHADLESLPKMWVTFSKIMLAHTPYAGMSCHDTKDMLHYLKRAWEVYSDSITEYTHVGHYSDDTAKCVTFFITQLDKPFIVETLKNVLSSLNVRPHTLFHPIMRVVRDDDGVLLHMEEGYTPPVSSHEENRSRLESFIAIDIAYADLKQAFPKESLTQSIRTLSLRIQTVMHYLLCVVEDWGRMRKILASHIRDIETNPDVALTNRDAPSSPYVMAQYLNWLCQDHFVMLGCRSYALISDAPNGKRGGVYTLGACVMSLGLYRETSIFNHRFLSFDRDSIKNALPVGRLFKTGFRSPVNRPARVDSFVWVDHNTQTVYQLIGTFTQHSYKESIIRIPFVQDKALSIAHDFDLNPMSYDGKRLMQSLEAIPHDEYWVFSCDDLRFICLQLMHFNEKSHPLLLHTLDPEQKNTTCIIFMGRDRYTASYKHSMARLLERMIGGRVTSVRGIVDSAPYARLICVLEHDAEDTHNLRATDEAWGTAQQELSQLTLTWFERLCDLWSVSQSTPLTEVFFDASYQGDFEPDVALQDFELLHNLRETDSYNVAFAKPREGADAPYCRKDEVSVEIRIISRGEPIPLAHLIHTLQNFGIHVHQEQTYILNQGDYALHVCLGSLDQHVSLSDEAHIQRLRETLKETLHNRHPSDLFNKLMTRTSLLWRSIHMFRTYAAYFKQIGQPFPVDFIANTLCQFPDLTEHLWYLFDMRFNPSYGEHDYDTESFDSALAQFETLLNDVESSDQDTFFRYLLTLLRATVRTTFYQGDGSVLACKLHSPSIDYVDDPKPLYEVFVCGFQMEGIHLRSSKVARGGIRFSDRPQDFRTEILQLMHAQNLKNAVIVPTGAKGGFIVRQANPSKDEVLQVYRIFIQSLLALCDHSPNKTDTVTESVPLRIPRRVTQNGMTTLCYDDHDPYLVVAADKGTATFSDDANQLAHDISFWLGDAFASGGSAGYDHKKLGITAKGALVSVAHHFERLGVSLDTDPISVMGIGDLSGDVFGNGMIVYPKMRLLAAFNHKHIFIDPQVTGCGDAFLKHAHEERLRLFDGALGWDAYNPNLLSPGGGIFDRHVKKINLSPEIQTRFQVPSSLSPDVLIRALLSHAYDLMWFGGIGTYIKGSEELYQGDTFNDRIRVSASDIQARVMGEGANLGITPLARIELAQKGIRINSDAVDNAGGVNCSDREVNLKILLKDMDTNERNTLLHAMSCDVVERILQDNHDQNTYLDRMENEAVNHHDLYCTWLQCMEEAFVLKRSTLFLEKDSVLRQSRTSLTRPELAILLSYTQLYLKRIILDHFDAFAGHISTSMQDYFPARALEAHGDSSTHHLLYRELTALMLTKRIMTSYSIHRMMQIWSGDAVQVIQAFLNAKKE